MNIKKATNFLKKADPQLAQLIRRYGLISISPPKANFESLIGSIISQQLSTKAAITIFNRFAQLVQMDFTPARIVKIPDDELRSVGLSGAKGRYIKDLSRNFMERPEYFSNLHLESDEEVVKRLTEVKGIGRWTAEMFLMFNLLREDVFPVDDLIIRNTVCRLFMPEGDHKKEEIVNRSKIWQPYRTIACLYMWKAVDSPIIHSEANQ